MKHIILIIDDDPLIVGTLKSKFSDWDVDIFSAGTTYEALDTLEKITPEVVLLDLLLDHPDGSEKIVNYMRTENRLAHVPIIVLTNLEASEHKQKMIDLGVQEYVVKGQVNLEELREKVKGYLEPKQV